MQYGWEIDPVETIQAFQFIPNEMSFLFDSGFSFHLIIPYVYKNQKILDVQPKIDLGLIRIPA